MSDPAVRDARRRSPQGGDRPSAAGSSRPLLLVLLAFAARPGHQDLRRTAVRHPHRLDDPDDRARRPRAGREDHLPILREPSDGDIVVFDDPTRRASRSSSSASSRRAARPSTSRTARSIVDGKPLDEPYMHGQPTTDPGEHPAARHGARGLRLADGRQPPEQRRQPVLRSPAGHRRFGAGRLDVLAALDDSAARSSARIDARDRGIAARLPARRYTTHSCPTRRDEPSIREQEACSTWTSSAPSSSSRSATTCRSSPVGDTVKVHYKIIEGNRERTQVFQGVVIRRHGAGNRETFTVRKISFGVGVERTFPVHSPKIEKIEIAEPRQGPPREALLPARQGRQGRPPQGEGLLGHSP